MSNRSARSGTRIVSGATWRLGALAAMLAVLLLGPLPVQPVAGAATGPPTHTREAARRPAEQARRPPVKGADDQAPPAVRQRQAPLATAAVTTPMLVIYERYSDIALAPGQDEAWAAGRFFGPGFPNVAGYFQQTSFGLRGFTPAAESWGTAGNGVVVVDAGTSNDDWSRPHDQRLSRAVTLADPSVNFASFDTNGDGLILANELAILVMHTIDQPQEQCPVARGFSPWPTVDGKQVAAALAGLGASTVGLMSWIHELGHVALGTADLYQFGVGSLDISGPTCGAGDNGLFAANAWNRQKFGWLTPTVVTRDGYYTVRRADTTAEAFLLQDPARPGEHLLVENRAATPGTYERGASDSGLVIWRVVDSPANGDPIDLIRADKSLGQKSSGPTFYGGGPFDAWDPSDPATPARTMDLAWRDGTPSKVAVRAIGPRGDRISAYFDVPGPGILVDPPLTPVTVFEEVVNDVTFPVRNTSDWSGAFEFALTGLPAGWSAGTDVKAIAAQTDGVASVQLVPALGAAPGDYTITVTSRSMSDPSVASQRDLTVRVLRSADLAVKLAGAPDPVRVGNELVYRAKVTNNGQSPADGVTLTDPLPANVQLLSASASQGACAGTTTVTCNLGTLADNASATVAITVLPTGGQVANTVSVASAEHDPDGANDSATAAIAVDGACTVVGTPGDDTLAGTPGHDVVCGLAGDDALSGGGGSDTLVGGPGDDVLRDGALLEGGTGNDALTGDAGNGLELGGPGDDRFDQGPAPDGAETIGGGPGFDTVSYADRSGGVQVSIDGLSNDGDTTNTGARDNVDTDVESVVGGTGGDVLTGSPGPDLLDGGLGDDQLAGLGGDDRLDGRGGADLLDGGPGEDLVGGGPGDDRLSLGWAADGADVLGGGTGVDHADGSSRQAGLRVTLDNTADDGEPAEGDNVLDDVEQVSGGWGDDVIVASGSSNRLWGGAGADRLNGLGGRDMLRGGGGDDVEHGGAGNDLFDQDEAGEGADLLRGGSGLDTVHYGQRFSPVRVTLDGSADDGDAQGEQDNVLPDVENVLTGSGNDELVGSGVRNVLESGRGADVILAGAGDDLIRAGAGDDLLVGEAGDDGLFGGEGTDSLDGGTGLDQCDGEPGEPVAGCES